MQGPYDEEDTVFGWVLMLVVFAVVLGMGVAIGKWVL